MLSQTARPLPQTIRGERPRTLQELGRRSLFTPRQGKSLPATSGRPQAPETEDFATVLKGKKIDLENGDYVIVVDVPDSKLTETKVRFDKDGEAHFRCNH